MFRLNVIFIFARVTANCDMHVGHWLRNLFIWLLPCKFRETLERFWYIPLSYKPAETSLKMSCYYFRNIVQFQFHFRWSDRQVVSSASPRIHRSTSVALYFCRSQAILSIFSMFSLKHLLMLMLELVTVYRKLLVKNSSGHSFTLRQKEPKKIIKYKRDLPLWV